MFGLTVKFFKGHNTALYFWNHEVDNLVIDMSISLLAETRKFIASDYSHFDWSDMPQIYSDFSIMLYKNSKQRSY